MFSFEEIRRTFAKTIGINQKNLDVNLSWQMFVDNLLEIAKESDRREC